MKTFAILAMLLASTTASHARSIQVEKAYTLPHVSIDGKETNYVAQAIVNIISKDIKVTVYNDICGSLTAEPGTIHCMAMAAPVANFTVPLIKREYNSCHTVVYAGGFDNSRFDGGHVEIEIQDHSTRTCEDFRPNIVEVKVTSFATRGRSHDAVYVMTK